MHNDRIKPLSVRILECKKRMSYSSLMTGCAVFSFFHLPFYAINLNNHIDERPPHGVALSY